MITVTNYYHYKPRYFKKLKNGLGCKVSSYSKRILFVVSLLGEVNLTSGITDQDVAATL